MAASAQDLIGAWRLQSWKFVYADGRPDEYPLGPDAEGFIMYTVDGHVSATLMRAGRARIAPVNDADKAAAFSDAFAYAGRYRVEDGTVYHAIMVSTNPALIGITSTRDIDLDGDRLTLAGPDFTPGQARSQQITWRRARTMAASS